MMGAGRILLVLLAASTSLLLQVSATCTSTSCYFGGTCSTVDNGIQCACTTEYTGSNCEYESFPSINTALKDFTQPGFGALIIFNGISFLRPSKIMKLEFYARITGTFYIGVWQKKTVPSGISYELKSKVAVSPTSTGQQTYQLPPANQMVVHADYVLSTHLPEPKSVPKRVIPTLSSASTSFSKYGLVWTDLFEFVYDDSKSDSELSVGTVLIWNAVSSSRGTIAIKPFCTPDDCLSDPCQNGGTCSFDEYSTAGYTCTCPSLFQGTNCETGASCVSNPCNNGGTCGPAAAGDDGYLCACSAERTGTNCETHILCLSNPCNTGETCHGNNSHSYICLSPSCRDSVIGLGYFGTQKVTATGRTCQRWDAMTPHSHSQTDSKFYEESMTDAANYCRNPGPWVEPWCYTTDPNLRFEACNIPGCSPDCDSSPCLNGATCVPDYVTGYSCTCASGYYEDNCGKYSVVTVRPSEHVYSGFNLDISGYVGAVVDIVPINTDDGSCHVAHTGVRVLPSDRQSGNDFFVGGSYNTYCYINRRYGTSLEYYTTLRLVSCSNVLKCDESRYFWFSWDDWTFSLGKGTEIGQNVLSTYDEDHFSADLTLMEFSGYTGHKTRFTVLGACKKNCLSCYYSGPTTSVCTKCSALYQLIDGECSALYPENNFYLRLVENPKKCLKSEITSSSVTSVAVTVSTTDCTPYKVSSGTKVNKSNTTVLIESTEWPNYFLRHAYSIYYLGKNSGADDIFRQDAILYMFNDTTNSQHIYMTSAMSELSSYYVLPQSDGSVKLSELSAYNTQSLFYPVAIPRTRTPVTDMKKPLTSDLDGSVALIFMFKGNSDINVYIGNSPDNLYVIRITTSEVSLGLSSDPVVSVSGTYLTLGQFNYYWISWENGIIKFGTGRTVYSNSMLTYYHDSPYTVKDMLVGGQYGDWYLLGQCSSNCVGCSFDIQTTSLTPVCHLCMSGYVVNKDHVQPCLKYRDLGCFSAPDDTGGDMNMTREAMSDLTPQKCAQKCYESNYKYAGTVAGNTCGCGDYFATFGQFTGDKCKVSCSGDSERHCGGSYANRIFVINPVRYSFTTDKSSTQIDTGMNVTAGHSLFLFDVMCKDTASVRLWESSNSIDKVYDIALGSQTISKGAPQSVQSSASTSTCTEWKRFWIYWKNGNIKFGGGTEAFERQLQSWTDIIPEEPVRITISSTTRYSHWYLDATCPEHCSSCFINSDNQTLCSRCDSSYFLYNNTCIEYRYLGCYNDGTVRDLPYHYPRESGPHTPEKCAASCYHDGYRWSGNQVGHECFCGNRYNTYGKASESFCNHDCTGQTETKCGTDWGNSVYEMNPGFKCYSSPCQNGGSCINDYVSETYTCSCPLEWMGGVHCELENPCLSDPCNDGGTCTPKVDGSYLCECTYGHIGTHCEFPEPCLSTPCQNDATCNSNGNTGHFTCSCFPGSVGLLCEIASTSGIWTKIKLSGENSWSTCTSYGCVSGPDLAYCQNLARHDTYYGANLIMYNPSTGHCCKMYCSDSAKKMITSASSANYGYEMWFYSVTTAATDFSQEFDAYSTCLSQKYEKTLDLAQCLTLATENHANGLDYAIGPDGVDCYTKLCYSTNKWTYSDDIWASRFLNENTPSVVYIPFNKMYSSSYVGWPYRGVNSYGYVTITSDSYRTYAYFDGYDTMTFGKVNNLCWGNVDLCPNGMTISYWLKFMGGDTSSSYTQQYINNGAYKSDSRGFAMRSYSNSCYFFWTSQTGAWGSVGVTCPSTDVWHHYAITWSEANGIAVYIDGVLKGYDNSKYVYSYGTTDYEWYFGGMEGETSYLYKPRFGIADFIVLNKEHDKYGVWQLYSTTHHGSVCDQSPCQNSGSCDKDLALLTESCNCTSSYIGQFCEYGNPCLSNPCENGATCTADPDTGTYVCNCTWDAMGVYCQFLDPCLSNPCMEDGTCSSDASTGFFQCKCLDTRIGISCEYPHPCLSDPCQNYGTCRPNVTAGTFECDCIYDSLGRLCEYDSVKETWRYQSSDSYKSGCSYQVTKYSVTLEECMKQTILYKSNIFNFEVATGNCEARTCASGEILLYSGYTGWKVYFREIQDMAMDFERLYSSGQGLSSSCYTPNSWSAVTLDQCKYLTRNTYGNTFNWNSDYCEAKRCYNYPNLELVSSSDYGVYSLKTGEYMMYIPMDQVSGSSVTVHGSYPSGYKYYSPPVVDEGRRGMKFNGEDQYVYLGYYLPKCIFSLDMCTYGITWSFWVKLLDDSEGYIISTGAFDDGSMGFTTMASSGIFKIYASKSSYRYYCETPTYDTSGVWYHVTATWSNDLGLAVYINGIQQCTDTSPDYYSQGSTFSYLYIGHSGPTSCCYGHFVLSDVMFWDRLKSRWDVWDVYSSTSHCDLDSADDVCTKNPCLNSGSCVRNENNTLDYCACAVGWIGLFCEVVDPCASDPCQNGATCNNNLEKEFFNCTCPWDYLGDHCQYKDPCLSDPCLNGGTCMIGFEGSYYCACLVDRVGHMCDIAVTHIDLAIVIDGAHSLSDDEFGKMKSFAIGLVNRVTISKNATRVAASIVRYSCGTAFYLSSYSTREDLQSAINPLSRYSESRNTHCSLQIVKSDIFHKSYGDRKDYRNVALFILGGTSDVYADLIAAEAEKLRQAGVFISVLAMASSSSLLADEVSLIATPPANSNIFYRTSYDDLVTDHSLYGDVMTSLYVLPEDPCMSDPCQNGASCLRGNWTEANATYNCLCADDYFGISCEWLQPCLSSPCQMGGSCEQEPVNGTFFCHCSYDYNLTMFDQIGVHCEYDNPCLSDPCQMEGTCLNHEEDGTYHCACQPDRAGINCEFDYRDPCQHFPCYNGGACSSGDPYKYFQCDCPVYATSEYCESFMCQDTSVLNFTKITNTLSRHMHIFRDMPITCKGDVSGVIFSSMEVGLFYFDIWQQISDTMYKLVISRKVYTRGIGREQVDFTTDDYIATEANYLWGYHYLTSSSTAVIQGFVEGTADSEGTPWNSNTMSRVISTDLYHYDLRVGTPISFADDTFSSRRSISALQPLVHIDVNGCVRLSLSNTYKTEETAWTVGLRGDISMEASIIKSCETGNLSMEFTWYRKSLTADDQFYSVVDKKYYMFGGAVLKMPAREFPPGLWRIKASIDTIPTSDQMFARVIQSELVGRITGGTFKTVSAGSTVTIDGGSKSNDPDADVTSGELFFSWSCSVGEINAVEISEEFNITECIPELHGIFDFTGGELSIDTSTVPAGTYTFRLRVHKDVRQAFAQQIITIVFGFVPVMSIGCLINCANRVVPTTKLSLVLQCAECTTLDELTYTWSLFALEGAEYVDEDLSVVAASDITGDGLVVKANSFIPGKYYKLRLLINCAICAESSSAYSFMTNLPPEPGSCLVDPTEGQSLVTEFLISCEGWISGGSSDPDIESVPLSYKFYSVSEDGSRSLIYTGTSAAMPPMPLSTGSPANDYVQTLVIEVSDIFGSATEMTTTVKVSPPDMSGSGGGAALMTGALGSISDNPKQAVQVMSTIGGLLNGGDDDNGGGGLSKEEASEIRKSMINTLSTMASSPEKPDDVIQLTQALGSAAGNPEEVDQQAVDEASSSLLTMTGSATAMLGDKPEDAERVGKSLMDTGMNVLAAGSQPPATATVDTGEVDEDAAQSPEEIAAMAAANAEADAAARAQLEANSKGTTDTLASVTNQVGSAILQTKAPGEDMSTMDNARGSMQLQKQKADALGGTMAGSADSGIVMPSNLQISSTSRRRKRAVNSKSNVNLKVSTFTSNPYSWGATTAGLGGTLNMTFQDESGAALDADNDLDFNFANTAVTVSVDVNLTLVAHPVFGLAYHKVNIAVANSSVILLLNPPQGAVVFDVLMKLGTQPTPRNYDYASLVLGNETTDPTNDGVYHIVPGSFVPQTGIYYVALRPYDPERWAEADATDQQSTSSPVESQTRRRRSATGAYTSGNTTGNATGYTVAITTTACRAWDTALQDWVISGEVDPSGTTLNNTKCKGRPVATRATFGCAFISPPNMIDFSSVFAKFAQLSENPAVFSLIISITLAYFLSLPFIYRQDVKDKERWKFDELDDNDPEDHYFYKITVETGLKRGAGTMSNVFFMLYGRYAESGKRRMVPKNRQGFSTASTRWLLMRSYACFGRLEYLRLWHDNSGKDSQAGWFVDTITFEDMKKGIKGTFIVRQDLSLQSDYGKTFTSIKAATKEQRAKFTYLLKRTTKTKFTDGHMWASIALIPFRSPFTRTQRISVCICALFLSMITSMMFYKTEDNVETPYQITLGPIKFTLQQLWVGFISAVIAVPPTMFIVQVYRGVNKEDVLRDEVELKMMMGHDYSTIIKKQKSAWNFGFGLYDDVSISDMSLLDDIEDEIGEEDGYRGGQTYNANSDKTINAPGTQSKEQRQETPETEDAQEEIPDMDLGDLENLGNLGKSNKKKEEKKKRKKKQQKEDSDEETDTDGENDEESTEDESEEEDDTEDESGEEEESEEECVEEEDEMTKAARENRRKKLSWCLLITAWTINILAILVPGFFCILYSMEWGRERAEAWLIAYLTSWVQAVFITDPIKVCVLAALATILVWRHILRAEEKSYKLDSKPFDFVLPSDQLINPEQLLEEKRKMEARTKAKKLLKEMVWHVILVLLCISISFGGAGEEGHNLHEGIYDMFIKTFDMTHDANQYFDWLENYFVPNYFVENDINGVQLKWRERRYLVDQTSYRVGPARLRQLRMPISQCNLHSFVRECVSAYDRGEQDKAPYGPLRDANFSDPSSYDPQSPWIYQTSGQTKGLIYMGKRFTYGAGGYVLEMDINRDLSLQKIRDIKNQLWIDRQTRAVLLEFTVYNPSIDLFAFVTLAAEFSETAGIVHFNTIQVLRAHTFGALSTFIYLCQAGLVIYIIVNLSLTIHKVVKVDGLSHFKDLKHIIDLVILVLAVSGGILYIMRTISLNSVLTQLKEENYKRYAPFARVSTVDDTYKFCVAFLNAVVIMKMIVLLKLIKRIGALARTLRHSGGAMASFFIVFFVFILAFGSAWHRMFVAHIQEFSTLVDTLWGMFSISLGSFDVEPMTDVSMTATFILFPLYMVTMNWIMLNILITIIMDSHYEFKSLPAPDDERVLGEMVNSFFGGLKGSNKVDSATMDPTFM